ncbi:MAG: GatB/YqeY domain-containing protein [Deferribacteres bacterium]|nr:GatB/YqeY domain-containing protein [candidate division KSB1 bacterium]MCB9509922.1 GatB/YqeY domain-containing protein [Deferribacteres bacterium]
MNMLDKLTDEMKSAMKSGDKIKLSTIRQLRAQMKDAQIAKGDELTEEEMMAVLNNAAKKRREAIKLYEQGGRDELAENEKAELAVIETYLPQQLSEAEISDIIDKAIAETGAAGPSDLGKVMGKIMGQVRGRADGKLVQQLVRTKLQ